MILKKIKMPSWMKGCYTLKSLFKEEMYNSVMYPTHVRIAECYIYCNEKDKEVIKEIIQEFKERYHGKK